MDSPLLGIAPTANNQGRERKFEIIGKAAAAADLGFGDSPSFRDPPRLYRSVSGKGTRMPDRRKLVMYSLSSALAGTFLGPRIASAGAKADLCQTCSGNGSCASGNCSSNGICKPGDVDPCEGKERSVFRCGKRVAYCCHFKGEPLKKCRQVTAS